MNKSAKPYRVGEKGAVAVLVAVLLMFLIGMVALVVDVGYLYATRSELQNAADAAALAGARQL
ncbi:pilus assembly protein TadG-related protein, partial [Geoalkalibacter sp.]|uniref:pilus assembly protein TadG-related protein n=1 Tax=Geoalkalibacter sp. TaxID=3041440 RepID=UPI00272E715A